MDKELIFVIGGVILVSLLIFSAVFTINYFWIKNIICPRFSRNVNLESKFDFMAGGCFVNYQGQWILKDSLRAGKLD